MDPSSSLCLMYDTLKLLSPPVSPHIPSVWYTHDKQTTFTFRIKGESVNVNLPILYADPKRYGGLQRIKDTFEQEGFLEARDETNPYEKIGRSIFINRAAVKIANIDSVHHVTKSIFTFDNQHSLSPFTFCDIAAGPGGFTQYLQYRFPNSTGYGMTLRSETLDWNRKIINMDKFTPFYGPDNSGNLYINSDPFISFLLSKEPKGVDLITADGGFELEDSNDKTLIHRQEFLSSRLLINQVLIGITCTKVGGNFVVKVFDTVTQISAEILFVLAQCFESILIFKPITSRPANSERYVVCNKRKEEVQQYYKLLSESVKMYTDTKYLESIFMDALPIQFTNWLRVSNEESINRQLGAAQNILLYLKGETPKITEYNIAKYLIIWNIPDTPTDRRNTRIFI